MPIDTATDDDVTAVSDAEIGIEAAVELDHRPIAPEVLAAAFSLIVLLPDQKIFKSRLKGLANALAAIAGARKKFVDERAAHDQQVAAARAELEAERAALRGRQVAVQIAEGQLQDRETRCRARETELGLRASDPEFVPIAGSSITKEPERRALRTDNRGVPFAAGTTITREAEQSETHAAARVRPSRAGAA